MERDSDEDSYLRKSLKPPGKEEAKKIRTADVFTTGMAARVCRVAPRTVSKWFDSGRISGYRIPGSNDRRITKAELLRFLKDNNLPLNELDDSKPISFDEEKHALCFTDRFSIVQALREELQGWNIIKEPSVAMFVVEMFRKNPLVVILDWLCGANECRSVVEASTALPTKPFVIAVAPDDGSAVIYSGCDSVFIWPDDVQRIVESVRANHQRR